MADGAALFRPALAESELLIRNQSMAMISPFMGFD
jgi:hypothetical protein